MTRHVLHGSPDSPCLDVECRVCNAGLGFCTVCFGAEASLPTDCPGVCLRPEQSDAISAGTLDFRDGVWAESEHVELGGSGCKRYWHCPASVIMSRGLRDEDSVYAAEGTAAHALAEACLLSGQHAIEYIGRRFGDFEVTDEMAEAVQVYLEHVRGNTGDGELQVELKVDLAAFSPPGPMRGKCDAVRYDGATRRLYVSDLKYGVRVQVRAEDNPQLRYYALGAMLSLRADQPVTELHASIVQPRAFGSAIRSTVIDAEELAGWSLELMERAAAALQPDAPAVPGEWCQFCPAAGRCAAQASAGLAVAGLEVAGLDNPALVVTAIDHRLLTPEQRAAGLHLADQLTTLVKDMRAAAKADLALNEHAIPGWKLVPSRPSQSWRDPVETETTLALVHDLAEDECFAPRKLASPAQVRGTLMERIYNAAKAEGRKLTKGGAEEMARSLLAPLIVSTSSGVNLAPVDDARPALPAPGTEFVSPPADI